MTHGIEEAFQVQIDNVYIAIVYYLLRSPKCIVASSPWAEALTPWRELSLIDGCQGWVDGLLHQSVNHGGDAQQALLAIVLRYLYSTDWVRTV